jgi:pyruvate formate lyase activating enzyme
MHVNYAGTVPISTVDWKGRSTVTVFFRGCPLRCPYCQNHLYLHGSNLVELTFLEDQIKKSKPFVSAVVFSGGEPLMQQAIIPLAEFAKDLGLSVGIHTNGCYPEMVSELIKRKVVDKFFIDIKAYLDDPLLYGKVAGCRNPEQIIASVIKTLETVDYYNMEMELRTTLIRDFIGSEEDVFSIAAWISEHIEDKKVTYVLQQGIPKYSLDETLRERLPLERCELYELGKIAKVFLENVKIRTKESGEETVLK